MLIKVGYDIIFEHPVPTPIVAMLHLHPGRQATIRRAEYLLVDSQVPISDYIDGFGNRCSRLTSPAGQIRFWNDAVVEDDGRPEPHNPAAKQHEIRDLPHDTIEFLIASRYCEVDRMVETAWQLFGAVPAGWARVQAVCDYVHRHIRFDYLQARSTRSAFDAHQERVGVCRDFAHLAITLCRCLNVPSRYCTGYLGDIGVPLVPSPMDFSAWFEVYLSGTWYTMDARHNVPRIARVLMARGRDAADVALLTSFGTNRLERFNVWCDKVGPEALLPAA